MPTIHQSLHITSELLVRSRQSDPLHALCNICGVCVTPYYWGLLFGSNGLCLAWGHYKPSTLYMTVTKVVCVVQVVGPHLGGLINSLTHTVNLLKFSVGQKLSVSSFVPFSTQLKLPCSEISMDDLLLLIFSSHILNSLSWLWLFTFLLLLLS